MHLTEPLLGPDPDSIPPMMFGFRYCSDSTENSWKEGADCSVIGDFHAVLKIWYWESQTTGLPEYSTEAPIFVP